MRSDRNARISYRVVARQHIGSLINGGQKGAGADDRCFAAWTPVAFSAKLTVGGALYTSDYSFMTKILNSSGILLRLMMAVAFLHLLPAIGSAQQLPSADAGADQSQAVEIPDPLTPELARELVSRLSDQEVRDLLLRRLDAVASEQALANENEQSAIAILIGAFTGVGTSIQEAVIALPKMAGGIQKLRIPLWATEAWAVCSAFWR